MHVFTPRELQQYIDKAVSLKALSADKRDAELADKLLAFAKEKLRQVIASDIVAAPNEIEEIENAEEENDDRRVDGPPL